LCGGKGWASLHCSGFPVWGAEWPSVCGEKGWRHPHVQGFRCEGRNGPPCVVKRGDLVSMNIKWKDAGHTNLTQVSIALFINTCPV
jgi:hypothetical protein